MGPTQGEQLRMLTVLCGGEYYQPGRIHDWWFAAIVNLLFAGAYSLIPLPLKFNYVMD